MALCLASGMMAQTVSISNASELVAFANRVNNGEMTLNAVLTADINMSGVAWDYPIGRWNPKVNNEQVTYRGHFDGQGHSITGFDYTTAQHWHGFFGVISHGAIVENFSISGTVTNENWGTLGTVCFSRGGNSIIRNIRSSMNFISKKNGQTVGGILAEANTNGNEGATLIDRCIFSGTIDGQDTGTDGKYAGILGFVAQSAAVQPTITNCIFDGELKNTSSDPKGSAYGGICGFKNQGTITIKNCLSIGSLPPITSGQIFGKVVGGTTSICTNSYYQGDRICGLELGNPISGTPVAVTDAQLASGEVCYKLGAAFRQTLGTDIYPLLDENSQPVIWNGNYQNPASTISLNENNSFGTYYDFNVDEVTMARTLTGGNWDVFCVPFDMTQAEIASQLGSGVEVKELTNVLSEGRNYTLVFSTASSIEAGKPYMIRVSSDVNSISLTGKTIKGDVKATTIDDLTFVGTYLYDEVPEGSIIIKDGKSLRVNGSNSLKAFRGYITADVSNIETLTFGLDGIENGVEPSHETGDSLTFAVLGNSISTYYDYVPSGYAVHYNADREKANDIQVGDQWWMQLSRMSGLSFLANASWSGSHVAFQSTTLNTISPFSSNERVNALGRAGKPDFIFVLGGTNDWACNNIPLGQYSTDSFTDSLTFRGAYAMLLHKLTTKYPKARIVCLSILPRDAGVNDKNSQGWSQADANESIRHIAEQFGQYYIDCTSIPFSSDWNKYAPDKLHPSASGFTLVAQHITDAMISQGIITADLKRDAEVDEAERLLDISFTADGIVNNGTYDATVGKHGTATTSYDAANDTYLGTTQATASDYFYATYDEGTPLADAFNGNVTWEMLVRLDALADQNGNTGKTCIMGSEQDGGWCFYNNLAQASTFSYSHKSGVKSTVKDFTGSWSLAVGKYYHLVVTMDRFSHTIRYYVNGELVRTGTRAATDMPLPQCGTVKGHEGMWICFGGDVTSGDCNAGAENSSACSFVFARIYNGALSEPAAIGLYNSDVKKFTDLEVADYEIDNVDKLVNFAKRVNAGEQKLNAVLTADIDMEGTTWNVPIGDWTVDGINSAYRGHFDGQGHTISNLTYTTTRNWHGFFGVLSEGATVENFNINGSVTNNNYNCIGTIGFTRDGNVTIRNVNSSLNITTTKNSQVVGGILAQADNGTTLIDCCTYSGTLDGQDTGTDGKYGGIVAFVNDNAAALPTITNCLFDGELKNTSSSPAGSAYGGICGFKNRGTVTIENCLSIGDLPAKTSGQIFGKVVGGATSICTNSYYQGANICGLGLGDPISGTPVEVTDAQLASGEVCWNLNEENFIDPNWRQMLEEEDYPKPYGDGAVVYQNTPDSYDCVYDQESFIAFLDVVIGLETEFVENTIAYDSILSEYAEDIESWESIDNYDDFVEAYKASMGLRESIMQSASNYAAYVEACESALNYMIENSLEGIWAIILKTYLEEAVMPDDDYPNGSYAYIIEYRELNDVAILAEITFVNQLLEKAIAGGITPGTEITRLLVNSSFDDGFNGWTEEYDNNISNIYQTLNEMPNGIYAMSLNGLFRAGTDVTSQFYAGQLYMNNIVNYFMSPGEDVVLTVDAEPGVNCLGEGGDAQYAWDDVEGWVPNSKDGCTIAFSAGRYQNFVVTEVTDGTLTVGMRNLGTGLTNDWMPFDNLHIYYMGDADEEETNNKLADVLASYRQRAQVILDFKWSEGGDYAQYPNMFNGLRDQLADAIAATDAATTGTEKMALIITFSSLFNEVHACRKAYIEFFRAANKLYDFISDLVDLNIISEDEYSYWEAEIDAAQSHYFNGDVTTEEALDIAEALSSNNLMLEPVDGVYQLANARDLLLFAMMVNSGKNDIDAVMTADIDMTDKAWPASIGNWNTNSVASAYKGHFDGQGYSITGLTYTTSKNWHGFFGVLSTGATVENFSISGSVTNNDYNDIGTIGFTRDGNVTIRNVSSSLNIMSMKNAQTIGGILAEANVGTTLIDRCTYSGTLDGQDTGTDGKYGGILGLVSRVSGSDVTISNCLFDGALANTVANPGATSGSAYGGICSFKNEGTITIKNCLSIGELPERTSGQIFGKEVGGLTTICINSYYKGPSIGMPLGNPISGTPVEVTDEQLASGETCYKLNGDQSDIAWYQTLAVDEYPVLQKGHLQVWFYEGAYTNVDPDGIVGVQADEPVQGGIYNLAGSKIGRITTPGIYIVEGRKVLVK